MREFWRHSNFVWRVGQKTVLALTQLRAKI
jgi:hypothetical protein